MTRTKELNQKLNSLEAKMKEQLNELDFQTIMLTPDLEKKLDLDDNVKIEFFYIRSWGWIGFAIQILDEKKEGIPGLGFSIHYYYDKDEVDSFIGQFEHVKDSETYKIQYYKTYANVISKYKMLKEELKKIYIQNKPLLEDYKKIREESKEIYLELIKIKRGEL